MKRPTKDRINGIFRKAGVSLKAEMYSLEIGWAYTDPAHRGRGISTNLIREILKEFETESSYATVRTRNDAMNKVLKRTGFREIGETYQGRNCNYIQLFVKT